MSSVDWKEKQSDKRRNEFLIDRSKIFKDVIVHWLGTTCQVEEKTHKTKSGHNTAKCNERSACAWKIWTWWIEIYQQVSGAKSLPTHCFKTMVLVLQCFISWSVNKDCYFITLANYPFRRKGMHYNKGFLSTFIDYKVRSSWDII